MGKIFNFNRRHGTLEGNTPYEQLKCTLKSA
jgi:hypothetical protein